MASGLLEELRDEGPGHAGKACVLALASHFPSPLPLARAQLSCLRE